MATYDTNNIFAKILRGEIPCFKVYENDHVLAFLDRPMLVMGSRRCCFFMGHWGHGGSSMR